MEETSTLMNKKVDDLTVGDALKINGAVLGLMVAVPAVVYGAAAAKVFVTNWRQERKARKALTTESE